MNLEDRSSIGEDLKVRDGDVGDDDRDLARFRDIDDSAKRVFFEIVTRAPAGLMLQHWESLARI